MDTQDWIGIITAITSLVSVVFAGIAALQAKRAHAIVNSQRTEMRTMIDLQDSALRTAGLVPPRDPSLVPASVGIEEGHKP